MTNYRTDLMDEILTSPEARNIVGQVSPIYGAAFVALWLFQVIGCQLDDMEEWSRAFQAETVPQTATWSLDYWEENYGIPRNPNMTASQRRARIISRIRDRAPMSPAKLARYITDVSGYECEIIENTGKNRFTLIRRDQSGPLGLVKLALNEAKPAHVIYKLNSTWQNEVATREAAAAMLRVLARLQTRPESRLNRLRLKPPAFQSRETIRLYSCWTALLLNKETFRFRRLTIGGGVNNWRVNDISFDGETLFNGAIRFDQQVRAETILGLGISSPPFRTREAAWLVNKQSARIQGKEIANAKLRMGYGAQTSTGAAAQGVAKTAVRQPYSTKASLITNKDFTFDGGYTFDGSKHFNANGVTPL